MNQKNGRTDPGPLRERARSLFISQATIDETLEWATPRQLDAIDRMLATELANREASKRARLMRQARFPVPKSLDGYDFANVRLPDGYTKEQLTGLDFAAKAQDLVFYGKTGRGKTHLATALGMLAIEQGRSVRFRQTAELVLQLGKAKRDGALDSLLRDLARADLIILDEFGYVPFDIDGARLLYQIIAGSYERRSIILRHEHRVQQMGDDLRRRQARRRDHRPHRPPRTPHRIHRPQPTRQPGPHVRQDGQPVKQTTGRHSSCRKPKKISDETRNTDLTKNSARASAAIYSVTTTAKANGLNPRLYVEWLLTEMPNAGELTDEVVDSFLPWSDRVPESCKLDPAAAEKAKEMPDDFIINIDPDAFDDEMANNAEEGL